LSYIKLTDIIKKYENGEETLYALNKINLNIEKGDMLSILGTSGSGKSTLLNLIGCLDKSTSGKFEFDDKDITNYNDKELAIIRNTKIGFIFQNFSLINEYSVIENVEIPLVYRNLLLGRSKRISKTEIRKLAIESLKQVNMETYSNKKITQLSGGQQQRVAIARALVTKPEVILADEPTGALDKTNSLNIFNILKNINETSNTTVIVVTHNEQLATFCKKTIVLEDGVIVT
jgi:putative ABC transport system ATP-binding protein